MEMHAFHSREQFATQRKFFLPLPDGTATTEWLGVFGKYSEVLIGNRTTYREESLAAAEKKDSKALRAAKISFLAKSCGDWSFAHPSDPAAEGDSAAEGTPFTVEALKQFLTDCPHLVDDLDNFIFDAAGFLASPKV